MTRNQPRAIQNVQLIKEVSFVVFDFETVTPTGRPPEPLELAAISLAPGLSIDQAESQSWLIKPPKEAPLTPFDTQQTGIRRQDIQDAPSASTVLEEFDHWLPRGTVMLVAHNARYDTAIVHRFERNCPYAASLPYVDTLALGKHLVPHLSNYKLDTLANHFALPIPTQRHRALPDVKVTAHIFLHLISLLASGSQTTIADLLHLAGYKVKSVQQNIPTQTTLW
ncbi:3`-5` exonuclease [Ktedonobacteria bacterium brp13]|nr:3`-5` exonuclease [Ktedonobacteria bacterium brp13]